MFSHTKRHIFSIIVGLLIAVIVAAGPVFAVQDNRAPEITVGDQLILTGEHFNPIMLADAVHDRDHGDEEIAWTITGNVDLVVAITDGVASVTPPAADWHGSETLTFEACDPAEACAAADAAFWVMPQSETEVEVIYTANAGFLITVGDTKILIDALFAGFENRYTPPPDVMDLMTTAQPPFDGVDLILATHDHRDHFVTAEVMQHMDHNPDAVFVAEEGIANRLLYAGYNAIPLDIQHDGDHVQIVVNGIGVEAIYLSHGIPLPNLGFIITVEGRRLFHTGDIDPESVTTSTLQAYGVTDRHIDIAFVPHFCLSETQYAPLVQDGIGADYVIAMHYKYTASVDYDTIATQFPDAITFHAEMEQWTLSPGEPES